MISLRLPNLYYLLICITLVPESHLLIFQNSLKFPEDANLSKEASDLIKELLAEPESRLRYDQICVHPFFNSLDLDNIRQSEFIDDVLMNFIDLMIVNFIVSVRCSTDFLFFF